MALTKVIGAGAEGLTLSSTSLTIANGLTLTDGNVTLASGHGIDFAATADLSDGDATPTQELFDDYEEGTWTPTFSNYSGTDQNVVGYYTKVGNLVTAGCRIGTDGTSDSSVATIAGLPFTVRTGAEDGAIG